MDVEELSMIGPTVDLASVDSIHRKRIVAFANHFIINTCSFLNKLSKTVDAKLLLVDSRLQKLEASLILLESKLTSIPGLDVAAPAELPAAPMPQVPATKESSEPLVEKEEKSAPEEEASESVEVALDDCLIKYVKMLQVGVPQPAVKLKMQQEGISQENQNLVLNR